MAKKIEIGEPCCGLPRTKNAWETDGHEPEGDIPIGSSGDGGAPVHTTLSSGPSGVGGAPIVMTASPGKEIGTVMIQEVNKGFAHLGELATQLGVQPLPKGGGGGARWFMASEDGLEYDVFEVLLALLARLRLLPKLPDVTLALEQTTDEAVRRQGALDQAESDVEQLRVQLAGCLTAAEGGASEPLLAHPGDYGWSKAYQAVLDLRDNYDVALGERLAVREALREAKVTLASGATIADGVGYLTSQVTDIRGELAKAGVSLDRGERASDGVRAIVQALGQRERERERGVVADAAVKVAIENRLDASQELAMKGAKVILEALGSGSSSTRVAAERLIREDDNWYVMVELLRLAESHTCPKCELSTRGDDSECCNECCNEECKGEWGTGCYHCHYPPFMDWPLARKLLLHRRAKQQGGSRG